MEINSFYQDMLGPLRRSAKNVKNNRCIFPDSLIEQTIPSEILLKKPLSVGR